MTNIKKTSIDVVILAAGKGSRMRSRSPKVMQTLAGKPLLLHVIEEANALAPDTIHVVVGHGAETVKSYFQDAQLNFVAQTEQLGTGHAVMQAVPFVNPDNTVLILYGDVPLIQANTLDKLINASQRSGFALLTITMDDPSGYGRIIRSEQGDITKIVEQKDANDSQLAVQEVNTGIMAVKAEFLERWLPQLQNANAQGEYYLTDIVAKAVADNIEVASVSSPTELEVTGINDRRQQATVERLYQQKLADRFLTQGLCLADPQRLDVRGKLVFGQDCFIDINCVFEGNVVLGDGVTIESNCVIKQATIGDQTRVKANSVIEDSRVADSCDIGPFARIRPGSKLMSNSKVGNFVETKKTVLGEGSKINHLSYVGDATVGANVNIGAGTITCNYDGVNKHQTTIDDGVFVGSNSALVAPVNIGKNATIGAGSTITGDVDAEQLAIARSKQKNLDGWKRPTKKSNRG